MMSNKNVISIAKDQIDEKLFTLQIIPIEKEKGVDAEQ